MGARAARNCKHLNARDHTNGKRRGRWVWVCSKCGTEDVWKKGWQAYGFIYGECPVCSDDGVDFVVCPKCVPEKAAIEGEPEW